ncbi:small RNA 2'-O-methyltransferase-like isoform X1 [Juglans microcarpa x Juglans regia]|uniref:small RNA 2'-O-methyltransferase-like isoform X1 n=2 Tax=Juglans microcarpa x Juglans regia TaxID=2249226 RepID=UPI001B7F05CE|nr:small RNA 2'-O-methyltransferase-like isoform X1 [Juglans microcarpa x Juglans regia]XP_041023720.1 small RNA 2'-O-methyltransferase-like isoform X1 [Juglans microcarpa x Juglans regia]
MMETGGSSAVAAKKATLTPKAIIYQTFGGEASYNVEEVQERAEYGCPGLAIPHKGPSLYRCSLQLPGISVVSGTFKKKKDAEQSAAEMAIEKLGIQISTNSLTQQEAWDKLVARVKYLFSNEFLSILHPLSGHLRAALQREGDLNGLVPVSVMALYDSKLSNLCKSINPKVESNPFLVIPLIMRVATRLSGILATSEGQLWIRRQSPYPPEIMDSSISQPSGSPQSTLIEAVCIPCSSEKAVETVTLDVSSTGYYLDAISKKLGLTDAANVLVSRTVGKTSSETRLYFVAHHSYMLDLSSDPLTAQVALHFERPLNARASYFSGHDIYGDAILASIGYTWKSKDLYYEDVSVKSYYRMLISKIPCGLYKLSREAVLMAELPSAFTTRTNWRGSFPRDILCTFCRQHRLSEPVFSTVTTPIKALSESPACGKKLKVTDSTEEEIEHEKGCARDTVARESAESAVTYQCEVKLFSKCQDLIAECFPKDSFKKQNDSVQNTSLKVLSWLNAYFRDLDMTPEKLHSTANSLEIRFCERNFFKEFALCRSIHNVYQSETQGAKFLDENHISMLNTLPGQGVFSLNIDGPDSGVCPSNGCLLFISYSVSLVTESGNRKEVLESSNGFEFEIGAGAVIPHLEAVVTQMSIDQSACFKMDMAPKEFVLAAAVVSARSLSLLSSKSCYLEYSVTLLRVTEPLEDRMEQALFSPPLSKQRVEYAVKHIRESCATTLVDFGCGSGSLLDSLLNYPTTLEKIVGIDISQKSLSRAAKILHSKLSRNTDGNGPITCVKSAILYDGSVTDFDSRSCGFDIGTCLEVIEHMEEDQAFLFGDVVLSSFCPKILIVSTPNYEYNVILQKANLSSQEEDPDEKTHLQSCKFRNHDHKFEWTREQFNRWATDLAAKYNYSVEFSGVGGSADMEPGFASQIAVFRRTSPPDEDEHLKDTDSAHHHKVIWEWNRSTYSS